MISKTKIKSFAVLTALLTLTNAAQAQLSFTQENDKSWKVTNSASENVDVVVYVEYDDFAISTETGTFTYTGQPVKLDVTGITYGNDETSVASTEYSVEEKTAYDVLSIDNNGGGKAKFNLTYTDNTNVGTTAKLTITNPKDAEFEQIVNFSITKAPLTITAKDKTITYGDSPANNGVEYDGFVNDETKTVLEGTLSYDYNYSQFVDKGDYKITPKGLTSNNYAITFVDGELTVEPKEVEIEWSSPTTFTYDGTPHTLTATAKATSLVNNDNCVLTVTGLGTNVGDYTATVSNIGNANYKLPETVTENFSITKASLTITANDKTITYGDSPANDGVVYDGFVNAENETVLSGELSYDYNYSQFDDAGEYKITLKDLTSNNYEITFVDGKLTVEPKEIGIEWSSPTTFTYDGTPHTLTATATSLVNNDNCALTVTGTGTNVGDYTATVSDFSNKNYKLPETVTENFSITKAALTITAKDKTITYGDSPANDGVKYDGFVSGENETVLSGELSYDYNYSQFVDVGDYKITPKGLTSNNYDITFVDGKLTVKKADIDIAGKISALELTFNRSEQELVEIEPIVGGNFEYSLTLDDAAFSSSIPKKTNVGEYTVYYRVKADKNHNDISETAENSVNTTILPWKVIPEIVLGETEFIYDGEAKTPALTSVTYEDIDLSGEYNEPLYQNNVKVGTANVTITNKTGSNYKFIKTVKFVIKPIPFEFLVGQRAEIKIPVSEQDLTFATDNPEISAVLRDNGYILTTSKNVRKGDKARITSEITDISVMVTDPFENFFDEEKWYKKDVVLSYPENADEWTLSVPDYENFTIADEGKNDVKCLIYDKLQNIIAQENFEVKIDKTFPVPFLKNDNYEFKLDEKNASKYFLRKNIGIEISADDNLSGIKNIQYSFDKENFTDYASPVTLPDGKNILYVRAVDAAENQSEVYSVDFTVFQGSSFTDNSEEEISSKTIYYLSEKVSDIDFAVNLNGNTIGAITDNANRVLNFSVSDNVIKVNKEYLKTLIPGDNKLLIHINPLGREDAWNDNLTSAPYDSQILTANLDVRYVVKTDNYQYVASKESDRDMVAFCQGDEVDMTLSVATDASDADYVSIDNFEVSQAQINKPIHFRVPLGVLKGGNEKLPITYYKDGYKFADTITFPADYPSENNIRVYDDVLAIDNGSNRIADGSYVWYLDAQEIHGENNQFIDLSKYLNDDNKTHVIYASVIDKESGLRFRVCPSDDFTVKSVSKKKAVAVKTYPNPAQSGHEGKIVLENFSDEDFSQMTIMLYNQLGSLAKKISDVKETNSVVLPKGFYSGVVMLREQKVLNFKIVVE